MKECVFIPRTKYKITFTIAAVILIFVTLITISSCSSESDDGTQSDATTAAASTLPSLNSTLPTQEPSPLPENYPQNLIPVMEEITIRSSAYNAEEGTASLIFDSNLEAEKILTFYSNHFLSLGFTEIPKSSAMDNNALREFQRHEAAETASVAINTAADDKQVTTVSVQGLPAEDFES